MTKGNGPPKSSHVAEFGMEYARLCSVLALSLVSTLILLWLVSFFFRLPVRYMIRIFPPSHSSWRYRWQMSIYLWFSCYWKFIQLSSYLFFNLDAHHNGVIVTSSFLHLTSQYHSVCTTPKAFLHVRHIMHGLRNPEVTQTNHNNSTSSFHPKRFTPHKPPK